MTDVVPVSDAELTEFDPGFRGELLRPEDPGYERHTGIFNAMVERRPALIARCDGVADVRAALAFARAGDRPLAIRCGGHSAAGKGTSDGIVIDLSLMQGVRVDRRNCTARVQPGMNWNMFDRETALSGLATPGGTISQTGVSGLTLGGGIGWLSRRFGLTCDNLLAAEVLTAEGEIVDCDAANRPELLWALRGGGGNFGVVTSFEFALHPVEKVYSAIIGWDARRAPEVMSEVAAFVETLPDSYGVELLLHTARPIPLFPEELHGRTALTCILFSTDPIAVAEKRFAPILEGLAPDYVVASRETTYVAHQSQLDLTAPAGRHSYWKAAYLERLGPAAIEVVVEAARAQPTEFGFVDLFLIGGEVARVPDDATAFGARGNQWSVSMVSQWAPADSGDVDEYVTWTRNLHEALSPHSGKGVYVNFLGADDADRIAEAYPDETLAKLATIKARYDPTNLFSTNHNVTPATA